MVFVCNMVFVCSYQLGGEDQQTAEGADPEALLSIPQAKFLFTQLRKVSIVH